MRYRLLLALDHSVWSAAAARACLRVASRAPDQVHVTAAHVVNVAPFSGHVLQDIAGMLGWEPVIVPQRVAEQVQHRGERLLAGFSTESAALGVEVNQQDAAALLGETGREVEAGDGLSNPAFLIGYREDPG
jgi:glutamate-1-semialdehyde aminotransferase